MGERGVKTHPAAELFPMMPDQDLRALADDIAANGLNQPIVTFDGQILDGRNRSRACEVAGVDPRYEEWSDPGCGPVAWVVSQNIHRRHLTATQRAVLAVELLPKLELEARERQGARNDLADDLVEKVPPSSRKARDVAAELAQVNHKYVSDAKKIAAERPDLFQKMKEGVVSIKEATKEVKGHVKEVKEAPKRAKPTFSLDTKKGRQVANTARERLEAVIFGLEGYALGAEELRIDRAVSVASAEEIEGWAKSLARSLRDLGKLKKRIQGECDSNG
jgi:hypothetical protein